jgi:hypothetical protein
MSVHEQEKIEISMGPDAANYNLTNHDAAT